jgi:hypothetical protein
VVKVHKAEVDCVMTYLASGRLGVVSEHLSGLDHITPVDKHMVFAAGLEYNCLTRHQQRRAVL